MIGITTNFRDIKVKHYYVKIDRWYIYGDDLMVLRYVPLIDLTKSLRWIIKVGQKYHYFTFHGKPFYKSYENIDALRTNLPDVIILENAKPVAHIDRKTSVLNAKNTIIVGTFLFTMFVLVFSYYHLKKKEEYIKKQRMMAIIKQEQKQQQKIRKVYYCYSNRNSFLKNFMYGAMVEDGRMVFQIPQAQKKVATAIQSQLVSPVKHMILYKNALGKFSFTNGIINITGYDACLDFINENNVPMTIQSLTSSGCQIQIDVNNCILGA